MRLPPAVVSDRGAVPGYPDGRAPGLYHVVARVSKENEETHWLPSERMEQLSDAVLLLPLSKDSRNVSIAKSERSLFGHNSIMLHDKTE